MKKFTASLLLVCALFAYVAVAQSLPKAAPAEVGMSADKLDKIPALLKEDIGKKMIPGVVIMVVRHGKMVMFDAEGLLDPGQTKPMTTDAIFRIYSMSKAITSVTAMTLVEQGKLKLDDKVSKYIPAFAHMKLIQKDGTLVDATREMTIEDLLRHTSGITYGFFGAGPGKKAYNDSKVLEGDYTNAEFADRIAHLPLSYEPGTTWDYSHSTDILGRVVEIITKKSLLEAERERVLNPLNMTDTGFYVTDTVKQPRIAEFFPNDRTIGVGAVVGDPRVQGKWESGGGGMVSTATDYSRFVEMLIEGGKLGNKRILKTETIANMTNDHTQGITPGPYYLPGAGYGFGLGFAVKKPGAPEGTPQGDYTWNGVGGTHFWVFPKDDMFVVFMIQSVRQRPHYMAVIPKMAYEAIDK